MPVERLNKSKVSRVGCSIFVGKSSGGARDSVPHCGAPLSIWRACGVGQSRYSYLDKTLIFPHNTVII